MSEAVHDIHFESEHPGVQSDLLNQLQDSNYNETYKEVFKYFFHMRYYFQKACG